MINFSVNQQAGPKVADGVWKQSFKRMEKVLKIRNGSEVSLAIVGDKAIKTLNCRYRGKNKVTDVLSFVRDRKEKFDFWPKNYLGEIIICLPQARRQAKKAKTSLNSELAMLLTHGFLHLNGYDHEKDKEAAVMEALQTKILGSK